MAVTHEEILNHQSLVIEYRAYSAYLIEFCKDKTIPTRSIQKKLEKNLLKAEKLEEKLADLKGRAERDEAGSALVNNELSTSLREIKANSETIVSSSRYLLFKKDSIAASEELNAVVDAAKNACR